jgi:DNA-binding transcriptional regulator YhcF (GntR family)
VRVGTCAPRSRAERQVCDAADRYRPGRRYARKVGRVLISIDPDTAAPPYEQIRVQIADQARTGVLPAGMRLPTVRRLADDLGVAPGTVARAYRELETDRVIETRGRHGTFVSAGGDAVAREAFAAAVDYADRIRRLGLGRDDARVHLDAAFRVAEAPSPVAGEARKT